MTHFVAIAIVRPEDDLTELLAPYDEALDVDPYIREGEPWRRVLAQLEEYDREHGNVRKAGQTTAEYLHEWDGGDWRENPAGLTPEVIAAGAELVSYSTYNPQSLWDWWTTGGRWGDVYYPETDNRTSVATYLGDLARHPEQVPPRVVFSQGDVLRRGVEGWFGFTEDHVADADWRELVKNLLLTHEPADTVVFLDLHI